MGMGLVALAAIVVVAVVIVGIVVAVIVSSSSRRTGGGHPPKGPIPSTPMRVASLRQFPSQRQAGTATELLLEDHGGNAFRHFVEGEVPYRVGEEVLVAGQALGQPAGDLVAGVGHQFVGVPAIARLQVQG